MSSKSHAACSIKTYVKTGGGEAEKEECTTDIVINVYKNRIFIVATHYKKLGTLISINREAALQQFNTDTYSTTTLFGKDDEQILAAARYIAESIDIDRPLLLSIALKCYDKETLTRVITTIKDLKTW